VDIWADGWIYRADLEPHFAWKVMGGNITGTDRVFVGMRGAAGNFFGFMYDPLNVWGYGALANYYCVYDDGVNAPLVFNTGTAPGSGISLRLGVGIEMGPAGLWLMFYLDNSIVYSFDLTAGGGSYLPQALGEVFDLYFLHYETAAAPSMMFVDYYEGKQFLDD